MVSPRIKPQKGLLTVMDLFPDEILLKIFDFLCAKSCYSIALCCKLFKEIIKELSYDKAVQYARNRFLERALTYFETCLRLSSDDLPRALKALDERAICQFNMMNKKAALRDLHFCIELSPTKAERYCYEATVFEIQGQLQQSLKMSQKAIELDPMNARGFFEQGYVLQELPFEAEMKGSIDAYTKCIELKYHRLYVAHFNRGWAKECSDDWEGAMEDYARTLELNPCFSQAARSMVRARAKLGKIDDIKQEVERLEQELMNPNADTYIHVYLGYNYEKLGEPEKALACFKAALDAGYPRVASIFHAMGCLLERLGRTEEALESYKKSSEVDKNHTIGLENYGKLLYRNGGGFDKVKEVYEEIKKVRIFCFFLQLFSCHRLFCNRETLAQ